MKTTDLIKLVLLPVFALVFAACPDSPSTPRAEEVQEAAEIAHEMATKMGYTPENRLTEIDRCAPVCFYMIYFTTTDDVSRFEARLRANGLVDPEPYEVTDDVDLFYEWALNRFKERRPRAGKDDLRHSRTSEATSCL